MIDRRQYGDDELDIEKVLSKMREEGASNTIKAAFKRKKKENTIASTKNNERLRKIQKGKEIFDEMKQAQYNQYLQDEAASNFSTLSNNVLRRQRKKNNAAIMIQTNYRSHRDGEKAVNKYVDKIKNTLTAVLKRKKAENSFSENRKAANTITAALRRKKEENTIAIKKDNLKKEQATRKQQQYKDLIKSGDIETAANQRLERIQNKTNQTQQIVKAIKTKNDAAVKIQSAVRNRNALN
jgi:hypothetical protein